MHGLRVVQVVTILLMELAILPVAHGYFLHMCAWPLVHTRPVISFGISFVLLHWLLGMVRARCPSMQLFGSCAHPRECVVVCEGY